MHKLNFSRDAPFPDDVNVALLKAPVTAFLGALGTEDISDLQRLERHGKLVFIV